LSAAPDSRTARIFEQEAWHRHLRGGEHAARLVDVHGAVLAVAWLVRVGSSRRHPYAPTESQFMSSTVITMTLSLSPAAPKEGAEVKAVARKAALSRT